MNLVDFQSEVFDIIHTFSGQANKIVVNTVFIDLVDDLETGLFYHNLSIGQIVQQEKMVIFIKRIASGMRKSELVNTVFEKQEKARGNERSENVCEKGKWCSYCTLQTR